MTESVHIELTQADLDKVWRPFTQHALHETPPMFVGGQGCVVVDADGKQYLDSMSGLCCVNMGYGQERLIEAATTQMRQLPFTSPFHTAQVTYDFAKELVQILPGKLNHALFLTSGSEANEAALKIARQYARQKFPQDNRSKVIGRYLNYHGWTFGANSASGHPFRKVAFEPFLPGFIHVRPPDMFRLFAGRSPSEVAHELAKELETVIEFEGPETIAAFIGEPIPAGGGVFVPPDEYWPLVREICDKYEILLILDEVVTGFGRTGAMFACEHWGVVPDMITMGKGISSGYAPLGAVAVTDEVFDAFLGELDDDVHFAQISTFGGHPVACAVALEALALISEQDLVANAAQMGDRLLEGLRGLQDRHEVVGDARGKGLLCGLELVDPKSGDPLPVSRVDEMAAEGEARGVLLHRTAGTARGRESVFIIGPPLVISADEIDRLVDVFDEVLGAVSV
jgi:taurine-pyruvate aminotransferase